MGIGISILILIGLLLLLLEFLVIPGTTFAALFGVGFIAAGSYLAFSYYGNRIGFYVLSATIIALVILLVVSLRSKTWKKFMLKTNINGSVSKLHFEELTIGDKGMAISRLNPMGKISINNKMYEASSNSEFINQKSNIEIIDIDSNRIIVKQIK